MVLTEDQKKRFLNYKKSNLSIFSDRIVQDFFQNEEHIHLLLEALEGNNDSKVLLDAKFRKHFFRVRFITYISSTIKYCAVDQMRSNQKNDTRNPLIFDKSVSDEEQGTTLGELLLSNQWIQPADPISSDPSRFQASFANESLSKAFSLLSKKQQMVTTFCYALRYHDNEIARLIGVSPQAVGKTRNLALKKLRAAMPERR